MSRRLEREEREGGRGREDSQITVTLPSHTRGGVTETIFQVTRQDLLRDRSRKKKWLRGDFYRLYMNFKHPGHAAGKLQACCRQGRHQAKGVNSNQGNRKISRFFFKSTVLFLVLAGPKTKTVLKRPCHEF